MSTSPVVYVVQDSKKNVVSAMDFGSIEIILPEGVQITFAAAPTVRRIREAMHKFNENDYIIAIGDPVAIGIACAVASERTGGKFKMLKWDRQENRYYPVTVDIEPQYL